MPGHDTTEDHSKVGASSLSSALHSEVSVYPNPVQIRVAGLLPATLALGCLYLILAVAHTVLSPELSVVLSPAALVSSLLLLGTYFAVKQAWFPNVDTRVWATGVAGVVLVNGLLHLELSRDPLMTVSLLMLVVGAGFLLLSTPCFLGLTFCTLSGWGSIAWSVLAMPAWQQAGAALVAASTLGFLLHSARLGGLRHLEAVRSEDRLRSQMYQQRAAHLETLISVGHSINAFLDQGALLNHVVQTLHSGFGYDFVGIFLTDRSGDYLVARAGTGEAGQRLMAEEYRLVVGELGLMGWASRHHELVCVNDVSLDSRYVRLGLLTDTESEMVVPLATGDVLLGLLDIQSSRKNAFQEDDRRVCLSLADQISIAIRNASRYEFEHDQRSLTEMLYTVGRALSQTLDVSEVFDLILTSLGQIVGYDRGSILLRRDEVLEIVAARGFPESRNPLDIRVPIKEGDVFRKIYETKEPLMIPEIAQRPDWEYVEDLPPARSWVGLPLINAEDEVIGMLSLAREKPNPYTADEVALGTTFAGQAGVALHNARLYMELSEAYRQLSSLDRAKSDFISLASHELRTPLTLVMGYSHMLLEEAMLRDNPYMFSMIQGLALGSERLQEIVDRMVDLAEIESQTLQLEFLPMCVHDLLKDVVDDLADALQERKIDVDLADLGACPDIEADRMALDKVFRHLLMNAIKYTPDGGEIRITAKSMPYDLYGLPERCVRITVADTGIGIDPVHQQRIFDKFYQTGEVSLHSSGTVKFRGGGPGLGLAVVKGIVEAHRGRVWVESPGHDMQACPGSSFNVVLPVQQPDVEYIMDDGEAPSST